MPHVRIRATLLLLLTSFAVSAPLAGQVAAARKPLNLERFRAQVDSFAVRDQASPPVPGGIVFVGSSIFRQWTTVTAQMAPLPVLNRAFGGSRTPEQLHFFDKTIVPYRPRVIVYYCGSNDVNANVPAPEIAERFFDFVKLARGAFPATRVVYASILRAPDKRARWAGVDSVNAAARAYAASDTLVTFVDLNPAVFDAAGNVRAELYKPDSLHYLPPAYDRFTVILKPVLDRVWAQVAPRAP